MAQVIVIVTLSSGRRAVEVTKLCSGSIPADLARVASRPVKYRVHTILSKRGELKSSVD